MAKDLGITILMDFYGEMLTDKRYSVMDMYYNSDLSLAEIGEDTIKHGEHQLMEYEEKLGLAKRFMDISSYIKEMNDVIDKLPDDEQKDKLKRLGSKIKEII